MRITCAFVVRSKKFAQLVPVPLSQERKRFPPFFFAFSDCAQSCVHFEKKDQLYSLNISVVSDSEKCGYLNAGKPLFQNTLRESSCLQVLNTAGMTMEALLSKLSIDPTHIQLEKVSVGEI